MAEPTPATLIAELRRLGIRNERVLMTLASLPRHLFVEATERGQAYVNTALPIGEGQTISQPYVVALMTEALALQTSDKVLEIGTGSGYQAAVLARLAGQVISLERRPALAETARQRLASLHLTNVRIEIGDGSLGWPAEAPYDAIIVTAAAPRIPPALIEQLAADHGRLVIPVGDADSQNLLLLTTTPSRRRVVNLGAVRFVPLVGSQGWAAGQADAG